MAKRRTPLLVDPIVDTVRNWTARGWRSQSHVAAALSIVRASEIVVERSMGWLRPLDLNFSRHEALMLLYFSRRGELTLARISERLMLHPASITTSVDHLERLGYVERLAHPTDRRATLARITPAGRAAVETSVGEALAASFGIGEVDEADADALVAILTRLRRGAGDFGAAPEAPPS